MSCPHCGASHDDVDVAERVATSGRRSLVFAGLCLAVAALGWLAAVVVGDPWPTMARAAAGWVVAAVTGSASLVLLSPRLGAPRAVVGAAVVSALVTVAAAWAADAGGGPVAAAAGWATAAGLVQLGQSIAWRRTLRRPGRTGELARERAVHAHDPRWAPRLAWWVVPVLAFALWVWALDAVPVSALVVLPAAAALQLLLARRNVAGDRESVGAHGR